MWKCGVCGGECPADATACIKCHFICGATQKSAAEGNAERSFAALGSIFALLALFMAGCHGVARYRAVASYGPVAVSSWDRVEIRVTGSRLPGHDLGNECAGTIQIQTNGAIRALEVKHEFSRTTVTGTYPKGLLAAGPALDSGVLLSIGPAVTRAEAEDILRAFDGACLGPKMGFPTTPSLRKLTEDSQYE